MKRRRFMQGLSVAALVSAGGVVVMWPAFRPRNAMRRIGMLTPSSGPQVAAFRDELRRLGWDDDAVDIEWRSTFGETDYGRASSHSTGGLIRVSSSPLPPARLSNRGM